MLFLSLGSVSAKPNTVVVFVKDSSGNAVPNCWVWVQIMETSNIGWEMIGQTNKLGKVSLSIPAAFPGTYISTSVWVGATEDGWYTLCGSFELDSKDSAKVTVTYIPFA